jgi:hypothetical protein
VKPAARTVAFEPAARAKQRSVAEPYRREAVSRKAQHVLLWAAFAACALLLLVALAYGQARGKRLILKDGSFQAADKWEIKGDRVRYHSSERFDWEELPKSLVDWPATDKFNSEIGTPTAAGREAEEEDRAAREAEEAAQPLVAPGLRLPSDSGVFLLDVYNDQPSVVELTQNGADLKKNTGKNILRATINPIASAKQTFELSPAHSQVQSHVTRPTLYVNVSQVDSDSDSDAGAKSTAGADKSKSKADLDQQPDRYRIVSVKVDQKRNTRVVGAMKISMIGKVSQEENYIAVKSEPMPGGWVKITPERDLAPGEYALVEMLDPKQMNLYVWDFGVNPSAGMNPTAWKPEPGSAQPEAPPKLSSPHEQ